MKRWFSMYRFSVWLIPWTATLSGGTATAPPPVLSAGLPAAETVPLVRAVLGAPVLASARARAEAARARLGSAGRFPDPELEGMLSRVSTPAEDYPMWELTLRQPLPKAGERAADRERATAGLSLAEAEYARLAGELAAEVSFALAEAEAAADRAALFERQARRTEQALAAVDARVGTSGARLADRLALQTSIAAQRLQIEQEQRRAADALAEARSRLALGPADPLPGFAAPTSAELDPEAAPAILLASAQGAAARASARLARASGRPRTAVGLRFEREEDPMGAMDTLGIAVMTELPWRGRRYARAEEKAAYAEEEASQAEAQAVRHRWHALAGRVERAERLAASARRLAQETRQRLDAEYDALLRAAGASGPANAAAPVLMLLEILERQTLTETQEIEADAAARAARAELWRFAPATAFPLQP